MTKPKRPPSKTTTIAIRTKPKIKLSARKTALQADLSLSEWVEGLIVAALKKETTNG